MLRKAYCRFVECMCLVSGENLADCPATVTAQNGVNITDEYAVTGPSHVTVCLYVLLCSALSLILYCKTHNFGNFV